MYIYIYIINMCIYMCGLIKRPHLWRRPALRRAFPGGQTRRPLPQRPGRPTWPSWRAPCTMRPDVGMKEYTNFKGMPQLPVIYNI